MSEDIYTVPISIRTTWKMWPERRRFKLALPGNDSYFIREFERKRSFYEADLLLHLAHRGPRGGLFLDVGAHIGSRQPVKPVHIRR